VRLSTEASSPNLYRTVAVPLPNAAVPSRLRAIFPDGLMSLAHRLDLVTTGAPPRGDALLLTEAASRAVAYHAFKSIYGSASFVQGLPSSGVAIRSELLPIAAGLLADLEADELAERDGEIWRLAEEPSLPPVPELVQSLLACDAERASEATYLSFLAVALPDILVADRPLPRISSSLAEALDVASAVREALVSTLREIVAATARDWPAGECLRVLVLGATDTAFVRAVGAAVALQVGRITISDPRADRLERLRGQLGGQPGIAIVSWDRIEIECPSTFDLIVGAELLQGCASPVEALCKLRELLVDEGSLVLTEPLPSIFIALRWIADLLRPDAAASGEAPDFHATNGSLEQLVKAAGFGSVGVAHLNTAATESVLVTAVREKAKSRSETGDRAAFASRHVAVVDADASAFGTALAVELAAFGCGARSSVDEPASAGVRETNGLNQATSDLERDEVVMAASLPAGDDPAAWVVERCACLTNVLMSFGERPGRLWLVAPGAVQVLGGRNIVRPESAALWGFARVATNEFPNLDIRLIDASPIMPPEQAAGRVVEEILLGRNERELLIDNAATFGLRVVCDDVALAGTRAANSEKTSRLVIESPGSLDDLKWRLTERRVLSAGEVEIEVRATGLNFRDVMWSLGLLPAEVLDSGFAGPTIGMECAGVVSRTGPGVVDISPGERCLAFAPAAFAQHVVVPEFAVAKLPDSISAAAAATIPVAFLTAYYSLKHLARVSPGETVLIHGGAGAVGLAAIQIVKWCGATPIATAGSPEKRALLQMLGVEHVLHSRSHSFVDGIMEITSGRGVDVVLNSLAGEFMERSIGCLRSFGRFIELGKRDFVADTRIGLRPFRQNLSYFGVDQLLTGQRKLAQQLVHELLDLFERGDLSPLPYRAFDAADVTPAFRLMQQAGHVGKIVVLPGPARLHISGEAPVMKIRADGSYLIIGGFGGLGLALARRLARRGARHVVLVGRSGASGDGAKLAVAELRAEGITVHEEALDAADASSMIALFGRLARQAPPIRGVFHAAMVLDDALIRSLAPERIEPVLRAKITSATLLDRLTRGMRLDWFVLFSSASTIVGNPGQASYVAANTFLEGLAQQRRAAGLPAVAVSWGAISGAGYLARKSNVSELLSRKLDKHTLTVEEALDGLEQILELDQTEPSLAVLGFARLDWRMITKELRIAATPLLEFLRQEGSAERGQESDSGLAKELAAMPAEEARARVAEMLCVEIGRVLRTPAAHIDRAKPLWDIGVDSLMEVELRLAAEQRLGIEVPLMSIGGAGSLNDLAGRIVKHIREKGTNVLAAEVATLAQRHFDTDSVKTEELTAIAASIETIETTVKQVF
jgi:NADPH:quinone reductase-like Zn-dependent oxidoreductase/NAD(P)-dependent dehydrogenase (short-subunit alcohol dehydrogenase family)/acyl carrier protein